MQHVKLKINLKRNIIFINKFWKRKKTLIKKVKYKK